MWVNNNSVSRFYPFLAGILQLRLFSCTCTMCTIHSINKNFLYLHVFGSVSLSDKRTPYYVFQYSDGISTPVHSLFQFYPIKIKPNGSEDNWIPCTDHIHLAEVPAVLLCRIYVLLWFLSLNVFLRQGHLPGTRRWYAIRFPKCSLLIK